MKLEEMMMAMMVVPIIFEKFISGFVIVRFEWEKYAFLAMFQTCRLLCRACDNRINGEFRGRICREYDDQADRRVDHDFL